MLAQHTRIGQFGSIDGGDVGDELLIGRALSVTLPGTRDDHRFAHRRMAGELSLDLAELDTKAADLDLMIVTAEELEVAVGAIASEVTGAVDACAGLVAEGIVEEALGGEFGPVQVATRHACATDVELAHGTWRHQLALRIEQINVRVGDGAGRLEPRLRLFVREAAIRGRRIQSLSVGP